MKKVARNVMKFTGKHLCQRLSFRCRPKKTLAQVFSCAFCEISKNTFSYRTPLVAASVNYRNNCNCSKTSPYKMSIGKKTIKKSKRKFYLFNSLYSDRKQNSRWKLYSHLLFNVPLKKFFT